MAEDDHVPTVLDLFYRAMESYQSLLEALNPADMPSLCKLYAQRTLVLDDPAKIAMYLQSTGLNKNIDRRYAHACIKSTLECYIYELVKRIDHTLVNRSQNSDRPEWLSKRRQSYNPSAGLAHRLSHFAIERRRGISVPLPASLSTLCVDAVSEVTALIQTTGVASPNPRQDTAIRQFLDIVPELLSSPLSSYRDVYFPVFRILLSLARILDGAVTMYTHDSSVVVVFDGEISDTTVAALPWPTIEQVRTYATPGDGKMSSKAYTYLRALSDYYTM